MKTWVLSCTIFLSLLTLDQVCCRCSFSDHSSLVKFNSSVSLNYQSSTDDKRLSWNTSSDCCAWEGVSCDQDGHVTQIEFSSNWEIKGTFNNSNSVFHLQHLKTLHMDPFESFTILNLTMFLQNFPQLQELYIEGADLSASGKDWCEALSSSVPMLRALILKSCSLSGPLDHSLLRLQSLSIIDLQFNEFNCPLPEFFANFSNLISLDLSNSGLQGTVPREIFQIPTLQSIDLSSNEFLQGTLPEFPINNSLQSIDLLGTKFSGKLPSSIGNLWNLSKLELSHCQFDGLLPRSIQNLTQLNFLSLSHNKFAGPIPSFSANLFYIDLSENSLNGEIASLHFKGLTNLERLILSGNSLNGSIPSSLFSLPSLFSADLSNNQFSSCLLVNSSYGYSLDLSHNNLEDLGSVLASMIKLDNLYSLDLSYNKLNGTIQSNTLQGFNGLELFDLSYNRFSANVSYQFLESFPQVVELYMVSCNLREFPHFNNQSNVRTLDLSNNQISGEIPISIWELGNGKLTFLNLSHNNLEAIQEPYSFPNSLIAIDLQSNRLRGKISFPQFLVYADFSSNSFNSVLTYVFNNNSDSYQFLSLSNNTLTGDLPKSICHDVNDGAILDLSRNKFSGRIPTCVTEASDSLDVLNLHKNNLRGPIPDTFTRDCNLKIIDLNGNFLDGEIPKSLANCTQLRVLDLGRNNLTGEFPCFLKNISTLQVLILRDNNLHGSIECPDSDGSWPALQILDIAQNRFCGELQVKWLENLQVMKNDTLGLESNALGISHYYPVNAARGKNNLKEYYEYVVTTVTLKGQERELSKVLAIYTWIDLSCNNFRGSIPEEFGQLLALKTLNLSNNALTGEIPSSLGDLRRLETLDLSRNKLNGTIPESLGGLNFLQFMILSFNQLTGKIPKGSQIQTFPEGFFIGNEGLCGNPLKKNCSHHEETQNPEEEGHENSGSDEIDWNFLSAEIGFIVGVGAFIAPMVFFRRWRILYFHRVDDIIVLIFPLAVARKWLRWTNTY